MVELQALAALGDAERLEEVLLEGSRLPAAMRTGFVAAIESRFTAALHGLRGEVEEAEAAYTDAEDGYQKLGLVYDLALTQTEHGELLNSAGRGDDAAPLLAGARATFERLGATFCLDRVARVAAATAV